MAEFTLASSGISTKPGGGSLNPQLRQGSTLVAAGTGAINPYAGLERFTPVKPARQTRDRTPAAVNSFLGTVSQAAVSVFQQEAAVLSQRTASDYELGLIKAFGELGDERATNNNLPSLAAFEAQAETRFNGALQNLSPAVRQQAVVPMFAARSKYLLKAADRRAAAHARAVADQRFENLKVVRSSFLADPTSIHNVDPVTGTTLKQRHDAQFESKEAAAKGWYETVQAVGQLTYLANGGGVNGYRAAQNYYTAVGNQELLGAPEVLAKAQGNLKKWSENAVRTASSELSASIRLNAAQTKQTQEANEATLIGEELNGKVQSQQDIAFMTLRGDLDPDIASGYVARNFADKRTVADPEAMVRYRNQILSTAPNGFRTDRGILVMSNFLADPAVNRDENAIAEIGALQKQITNPASLGRYKMLNEQASVAIAGSVYTQGFRAEDIAEMQNQASRDISTMLRGGMSEKTISEYIDASYNFNKIPINRLPRPTLVAKPVQMIDVHKARVTYFEAFQSGLISRPQYNAEMRNLRRYEAAFNEQAGTTP